MKEKLSKQLRELTGQTSHSTQTWDAYVENVVVPFAPTEEDKLPEYLQKHAVYLKTQNGQYSKDIATTVNTQVDAKIEEFKKNYKPDAKPDPGKPKRDDEMAKRLDALEQAYEREKKANAINSLRDAVRSKAGDLKVARRPLWDDVVSAMDIPDNATSESLLESAKTAYETKLKSYLGDGATPYQGEATPPKGDGSEFDDFFSKKAEQGKMPKEE